MTRTARLRPARGEEVSDRRPARADVATRVAVGSVVAAGVMVCGLWLALDARRLTQPSAATHPELLEVGVRAAGVAVMAAAQVLARQIVVGALYPLRRGDWLFEWVATAVLVVAAVGAAVFGLSGW
jgi:hypothetical protein